MMIIAGTYPRRPPMDMRAEVVLELGVYRAIVLLRKGYSLDHIERVLLVAADAADHIDRQALA